MINNGELHDSGAAIRLGDKAADAGETRWGMLLVLFMRIVAAMWIMQGLTQWQVVLMAEGSLFDQVGSSIGIAVVFFAVMDLVAAVGMWLATPWGGVLWLLVSASQIVVSIVMPNFFAGGRLVVALNIVLLLIYLVLTYQAGRDPAEARRAPRRASRGFADRINMSERISAQFARALAALKTFAASKPVPPQQ